MICINLYQKCIDLMFINSNYDRNSRYWQAIVSSNLNLTLKQELLKRIPPEQYTLAFPSCSQPQGLEIFEILWKLYGRSDAIIYIGAFWQCFVFPTQYFIKELSPLLAIQWSVYTTISYSLCSENILSRKAIRGPSQCHQRPTLPSDVSPLQRCLFIDSFHPVHFDKSGK